MEKTCRTCESQYPLWQCADERCGLASLVPVRTPHRRACSYHKPHETPLLVDTLAKALHMVWGRRYTNGDESGITPGYTIRLTDAECEAVKTALARYKEEVGDA